MFFWCACSCYRFRLFKDLRGQNYIFRKVLVYCQDISIRFFFFAFFVFLEDISLTFTFSLFSLSDCQQYSNLSLLLHTLPSIPDFFHVQPRVEPYIKFTLCPICSSEEANKYYHITKVHSLLYICSVLCKIKQKKTRWGNDVRPVQFFLPFSQLSFYIMTAAFYLYLIV